MQRVLRVIANPFHVIDHNNRPHCVVPVPNISGRFVGAVMDEVATNATRSDAQGSRVGGKAVFSFLTDDAGKLLEQAFPAEPLYMAAFASAILDGALLAADADTAKMVGVTDFQDPHAQLKAERSAAAARVEAEGRKPGAWATDDNYFAPKAAAPAQDTPAQAAEPKAEAPEPAPKPQRKSADKENG